MYQTWNRTIPWSYQKEQRYIFQWCIFQTRKIQKRKGSVNVSWDILARLICISNYKSRNASFEKAHKYPLNPVPWSLSNVDGSMRKTSKSKLINRMKPHWRETTKLDGCFSMVVLNLQKQRFQESLRSSYQMERIKNKWLKYYLKHFRKIGKTNLKLCANEVILSREDLCLSLT